jgi:hypothetical protein
LNISTNNIISVEAAKVIMWLTDLWDYRKHKQQQFKGNVKRWYLYWFESIGCPFKKLELQD